MKEIETRLDILESKLKRLQAQHAETRPAGVTSAEIRQLDRQRVELQEELDALNALGGTAPQEMSTIIRQGVDSLERNVDATAARCGL